MGLTASLNIGKSALAASQIAIQVTGNNFANASTPGYSRQVVEFGAVRDQEWGPHFVGRGVGVLGISRQVDTGLLARLNSAISDETAAGIDQSLLSQIEATVNALGDDDLTSQLTEFFNAWSTLANSPHQDGARALVIQQGKSLANSIRTLRTELGRYSRQIDAQLAPAVDRANALLSQIAQLNSQIGTAEGGGPAKANSLRDQRDQAITELSGLIDISVVEQGSGSVNILVGSIPIVLDATSRGIKLQTTPTTTGTDVTVNVGDDSTELHIQSGTIGGLLRNREGLAQITIDRLDDVASQLIFEVNRLHAQGVGTARLTTATGNLKLLSGESTLALNDPTNLTLAGLPFRAVTGGFNVTVRNTQTGATQTVRLDVDLDGITNTGAQGYTNDTSVASLATQLNSVANLAATVQADGTLKIDAANGFTVSFGQDTSGVLAVLGINTYFSGKNAVDIDVRAELAADSTLLSTGAITDGNPVDNGTALAIAGLRTQGVAGLNNRSIAQAWTDAAADVGVQTAAAVSRAGAARTVRQGLDSQRQAVSGVDLDEETINLMNYQRQYQGAARFITVVDELTQTLLAMVG